MKTFGARIGCNCGCNFVEIKTVQPDKDRRNWLMNIKCPNCYREALVELSIKVISVKDGNGKVES